MYLELGVAALSHVVPTEVQHLDDVVFLQGEEDLLAADLLELVPVEVEFLEHVVV